MANETSHVLEEVRAEKLEPWWCLDVYFVAHLAEQLTKLRDSGHGYSLRFKSADEWNAYLTGMIEALEAYDVDDVLAYANAQQALHEFAAYLNDFWD